MGVVTVYDFADLVTQAQNAAAGTVINIGEAFCIFITITSRGGLNFGQFFFMPRLHEFKLLLESKIINDLKYCVYFVGRHKKNSLHNNPSTPIFRREKIYWQCATMGAVS